MQSKIYRIIGAILLGAGLIFSQNAPADLAKKYIKSGSLLYFPLKNAPFPHPDRENGYVYKDKTYPKLDHYDDNKVAVFYPHEFQMNKKSVNVIVYFHGWYNNLDSIIRTFGIIDQFVKARKDAILIIPQGPKNAPDSFGGKLEGQNGFKYMVDEVIDILYNLTLLETRNVENIIIAGHSGAYRVISFILLRGGYTDRIREVYLFDALYGQTEKYTWWIDHYQGKLIDIYTPDGGTKAESENLMTDLTAWQIPYLSVIESELTPDQLRTNRLVFISSEQEHNEVVFKTENLWRFLEASPLKTIPR